MNKISLLAVMWVIPMLLTGCVTPFQKAAQQGDTAEVRRLLTTGIDINTQFRVGAGDTALQEAAGNGHPEVVRLLLDKGAAVNIKDYNGGTALMGAASHGDAECVRLLLDHGADVNATTSHGWAALIHAVYHGRTECVRLLLDHGANIEARTQGNEYAPSRTALEWAKAKNFPEIVKLIEAAAQERLARKAAEEKRRIEEQIKGATLAQLLEKREFGNEAFVEALTEALIRAKNGELPALIVKAAVEQRVALVTTVETRLAQAQAVVVELNGKAEDAVRKNEDAAGYRRQVGKLQVYMAVLTDIKNLLQQS